MIIEFIIPTHNNPNRLMTILSSLTVQTKTNWRAHVVIDNPTPNIYQGVIDYYKNNKKIRFSFLDDAPHKDWGHAARNYGLDNVIEEWIVMTGDDNYYVPTFVEEFSKDISKSTTLVFCDFVHNLVRPGGYQPVKSIMKMGYIDIGNVMFRKDKMGDIRLNPKSYEADYLFFDEFNKKNKHYGIKKIDKILYVHN